jgi:hypothetical protein
MNPLEPHRFGRLRSVSRCQLVSDQLRKDGSTSHKARFGREWPIPCLFTVWLVVVTSLFVLADCGVEEPRSLPHPPRSATHGQRVVPLATSDQNPPRLASGASGIASLDRASAQRTLADRWWRSRVSRSRVQL